MGLAVRVIPTLLCRGEQLVKGQRFQSWRSVGHALQAARIHNARGVDELILLDIAATPEGRGPNLDLVRKLADECFIPLTVGGGVRTVDDVRDLLNAGADKVAICSGAFHSTLVRDATDKFGSQAIVGVVDYKGFTAYAKCGTEAKTVGPEAWSEWLAFSGAGEIMLTNIECEGTQEGYDLHTIEKVAQDVSVPVIAHGGCSGYNDMVRAVRAGASAVAAGALFQFTDATPKGASKFLQQHGIEARV